MKKIFFDEKDTTDSMDRLDADRRKIIADLEVVTADMVLYDTYGEQHLKYKATVLEKEHIALALRENELPLDDLNAIRHIRGQIAEVKKLIQSPANMQTRKNELLIEQGRIENALMRHQKEMEKAKRKRTTPPGD